MKTITKLASLIAVATGLTLSVQSPIAQAKVHPVTRVSTLTYGTPWKGIAKKGYLYTSYRLTKKAHHMTNFKHTVLKVTQKVTVKQAGHHAVYYHVHSTNGKLKGYIWHGNIHHYIQKIKSVKNQPVKGNPGWDKDTGNDKSSTKKSTVNFNLDDYRQKALSELNQERTKRGLQPVTEDSQLDQLAQTRAKQLPTNNSHYASDSKTLIAQQLSQQMGITNWNAECISTKGWSGDEAVNFNWDLDKPISANTPFGAAAAIDNVNVYIYQDAGSNWGHKRILLDPDNKTVGFGGILITNKDKTSLYTTFEFGK